MRGKEIITKLIIPGAIAMIICLIVHPMCMNGEILDWRKLLLFVGIPFGIQKMFLLVVPRNVGTGEMLGLVVLKLMVGSLIGIGVLAWRLLAVAGILLKNGISGIIWIIKRLKRFYVADVSRSNGTSGQGLYIVKKLLLMMNCTNPIIEIHDHNFMITIDFSPLLIKK